MFERGDKVEMRFTTLVNDKWEEYYYDGDDRLHYILYQDGEYYSYLKDRVEIRGAVLPLHNPEDSEWMRIHNIDQ